VSLLASVVLSLGSLLFAVSNSETFDLYIPAYVLIGIGGVFVWMSVLHLLNLFPKQRGFLVTLFTGGMLQFSSLQWKCSQSNSSSSVAEDASTGVFLLFQLLYNAGISLRGLFLLYIIVPASFLIVAFLQPKKPIVSEV
jgi:hypothetical protein